MFLGALGKREGDEGISNLAADERPIVRRQAVKVAMTSAVIGLVAAASIYWMVELLGRGA